MVYLRATSPYVALTAIRYTLFLGVESIATSIVSASSRTRWPRSFELVGFLAMLVFGNETSLV